MKRHLHDRHSGGKPFDCLICSKSFKQKNHLKRHMNSLHSSDRQISCDLSGKRLFSCGFCGKKSKDRFNLERHMRVHDGKRPYDCEKCYKSFKYPGCLKDHMISWHSSDKQFSSEKCLKQRKKLFHNINVIFATLQWTGRLTLKHTCLYGTAFEDV